MTTDWLIVDGNNLVHKAPPGLVGSRKRDFPAARWRLARKIDELGGQFAPRVTIVFDGSRGGRDAAFESSSVEVVFCPGHVSADEWIEKAVQRHRDPQQVLVVTSDRTVRTAVEGSGAFSMSCGRFLDLIAENREDLGERLVRQAGAQGPTLGDFFPGD